MSNSVGIIFPHQLFEENPLFNKVKKFIIVEEHLFFNQYNFHKQKLVFHRTTMKFYQDYLNSKGFETTYIEANDEKSNIKNLLINLPENEIFIIHPEDNWLEKNIKKANKKVYFLDSPSFINTHSDLSFFFKKEKKKFHQTTFYKQERKRLNILMNTDGKPIGGKWTFDTENRKRYPKNKIPPIIQFPDKNIFYEEAIKYVNIHFRNNIGEITSTPLYPITFEHAKKWYEQFLTLRFHEFGAYEDAIVQNENFLHHSVLSPLLNIGFLLPEKIIETAIEYATKNDIPINSTEGFVRQIMGWREFIRGIYSTKGTYERTLNFWNFNKPMPTSFYNGTTGIPPIDKTIKKILKTGYCHHIERLMILSNFMTLCEINPDEVYQWFMELFIDAYDWVMVPNVYGMSLFADGGLMSTKPYISSSNYLMKMSNYTKGDWQYTWDALFWRFMDKQQYFFRSNPRLAVLLKHWDNKPLEEKQNLLKNASSFLKKLD